MPDPRRFLIDRLETPLGVSILISDAQGALRLHAWDDAGDPWRERCRRRLGAVELAEGRDRFGHAAALARYFEGEIAALERLPVALAGTAFQSQVWRALREIAPGATSSYAALARRIGRPKAVRAVGLANGSNPVGVVVPCHRVVGSDGSLTGYGGGLARKRWLLAHEARHAGQRLEASA